MSDDLNSSQGFVYVARSGRLHFGLTHSAGLDRLSQAWIIVSAARHIGPFRDRPHAQKVVRSGSQQLNTGLPG